MSRIDIIAEVLVQEIETLKTTVKEVKELQQKGVEINPKDRLKDLANKLGITPKEALAIIM